MFNTILIIDNYLRKKIDKKSIILVIYRRYIGFELIYHENIGSVVYARISLIFR